MKKLLQKFDSNVIRHLQTWEIPLARLAIFVVYFWFGLLKFLDLSPAASLVEALFQKIIWFMSFQTFYFVFSLAEMAIGIIFLIRGLERLAIFLLGLHLITTVLPLFFLPEITWQGFLIPSLEGQYIIKNVLIVVAAVVVGSKLVSAKKHRI